MTGNIPITPQNPNGPLNVISIGRLSQPKDTPDETLQSLEAIRRENERMLSAIYSGPKYIKYLAEQISGQLAVRATMTELWDLVASGEWDIIVAEDLSRIFRNPRFQWAFVQDCVDAGIRVICFADNLDTADENWETQLHVATLRHGLTIPDTRRRIKRTATEKFHAGGQVNKHRAGYLRVSKEDAAAEKYGPKGLRLRRDPEFADVLTEIRRRFAAGHSPHSVVAWLNDQGIPTGPYAESESWTVKLLKDTLQDSVFCGYRQFRKVVHTLKFKTGKYDRDKNPNPDTEYFAQLAHMTREEQEEMLAYVGWRIRWNYAVPPEVSHPRKGISRYQSLWPGQGATCRVCGGMMYVFGDFLRCQHTIKALGQTCWNHVQVSIAPMRAFLVGWLIQQFNTSEPFRAIMLPAIKEQLRLRNSQRQSQSDRHDAETRALEIQERNLRKSIKAVKELTGSELESLVIDLAAVTKQLSAKQQLADSAEPISDEFAEMSDDQITENLEKVLRHLLDTSYEMAEVVRGFVARCEIVPLKSIDSGQIHEQNFIRATRSTGYRSTGSAISELVDNAIQAGATRIDILIEAAGVGRAKELTVAVADNGCGMDATTLRTALRFGGSTRFDDRSGQGRFGMGLPNASLSQAQRLEVYSWRKPGQFIASHIDVDEIARGEMTVIPPARRRRPPEVKVRLAKASGTLVIWERCDLLDNRRTATVAAKLHLALGRQFRYFLWNGVKIRINGDGVAPLDPLFLKMQGRECATLFGKPLVYELHVPNQPNTTSLVTVRFAELPLADWFSLSPEDKRRRGISKGAGASIVRAGREVDFGWYLFGEKRKENYDDWWRCEITYEPELDEYFGITHSKQSINPTFDLREVMCKDIEAIAHVLNGRARKTYAAIKATTPEPSPAATAASRNDKYLPRPSGRANKSGRHDNGHARLTKNTPQRLNYKIQERRLNCPDFFSYQVKVNGLITITINTDHAFYDHVYAPMKEILRVENRQAIECFLLAAVRAEVSVATDGNSACFDAFRTAWSDALETFLDA